MTSGTDVLTIRRWVLHRADSGRARRTVDQCDRTIARSVDEPVVRYRCRLLP